MAKIFDSTGSNITKSGSILVTKGFRALLIRTSLEYDALTTEQIKVEIERANGSNHEITKGFKSLKDFLLATTYMGDALTSDDTHSTIAECEICEGGSIELQDKDVIKFEMQNLKSAASYVVNTLEDDEFSEHILEFEDKAMSSEDTNKSFQVGGNDLLVMTKSNTIEEVAYTFENGNVVKYTLDELVCLSRSVDPVAYVMANGVVKSCFPERVQLPLEGVETIEIRKSQGTVINLFLRKA